MTYPFPQLVDFSKEIAPEGVAFIALYEFQSNLLKGYCRLCIVFGRKHIAALRKVVIRL
jgi:hypothetical protein